MRALIPYAAAVAAFGGAYYLSTKARHLREGRGGVGYVPNINNLLRDGPKMPEFVAAGAAIVAFWVLR